MSPMGWIDTGDMKVEIGVTGDGGSTMGGCKMGKMGQKAKCCQNRQKWSKNDEKKMKKFPISCLKSMPLYFSHHIISEKNEKMAWGGPWGCTNLPKAIWPVLATKWHVVTQVMGWYWLLSVIFSINMLVLGPGNNTLIVRSCGAVVVRPWPCINEAKMTKNTYDRRKSSRAWNAQLCHLLILLLLWKI